MTYPVDYPGRQAEIDRIVALSFDELESQTADLKRILDRLGLDYHGKPQSGLMGMFLHDEQRLK